MASEPNQLPLRVIGISRDTYIVFADITGSLKEFKEKYYKTTGLKTKSQHVVWKGRHLDDDEMTLVDYGVNNDFELHLVFDMYLPVSYRSMYNIPDPPLQPLEYFS